MRGVASSPGGMLHPKPSHRWLLGGHGFDRAEKGREFMGFSPWGALTGGPEHLSDRF